MMNRRRFFKALGLGTTALVVAPINFVKKLGTDFIPWSQTGYKGITTLEAGFIYCPYIPITRSYNVNGVSMTPKEFWKNHKL